MRLDLSESIGTREKIKEQSITEPTVSFLRVTASIFNKHVCEDDRWKGRSKDETKILKGILDKNERETYRNGLK